MLKEDSLEVLNELQKMFPNASCELVYHNTFELLIAVALSAQTTDKAVNKVTIDLFAKYPDPLSLMNASLCDVQSIIKPIGLSKTKSTNIINLSKKLVECFDGVVPHTLNELTTLPGVGRKTANVVLSEGFKIPRIAVDTHVERVSKRLGFANVDDSVLEVENKLMELLPEHLYHKGHHLLLFFGRYFCKSLNPNCESCPFKYRCRKDK